MRRAEARALLGPALFTAAMVALLTTLGVWQMRRLSWKEALIARVEARAHAAPVDLPPRDEWTALRPDDYDFLHVSAAGRYDLAREALIFTPPPVGAGVEPGYRVITPFLLDGGGIILVDRGFLPLSKQSNEARRREPAGEANIRGVLRRPQARNLFTPADAPTTGVFYTSDARAISSYLQLHAVAPFIMELDPRSDARVLADDLPHAFEVNVELTNNHLSYAITWFALAAAVLGGFAFYARTRLRGC